MSVMFHDGDFYMQMRDQAERDLDELNMYPLTREGVDTRIAFIERAIDRRVQIRDYALREGAEFNSRLSATGMDISITRWLVFLADALAYKQTLRSLMGDTDEG